MTVTTKTGITLEHRIAERAWMGMVVMVCIIAGLLAWVVAWVMCVRRGCTSEPQPANNTAFYQAAWASGVYGDELADWANEKEVK